MSLEEESEVEVPTQETEQSQDVEHSYVEQNPQPARARLKSIAALNLGNSLDSGFTVYRWIRVA